MKKGNLLKKITYIFDKKKIFFFVLLFIIALVSAALEILGLSLIYPIASSIISNQETYFEFQEIFKIKSFLSDDKNIRMLQLFIFISLLYLIKNIFLIFTNYIQTDFVLKLSRTLSLRVFKVYLKKPLIYFLNFNSSLMIRNCTALVSAFAQQLMPAVLSIVVEIVLLSTMLIFLLNIDFYITLFAIIFFSITIFLVHILTKKKNYENASIIKKLWAEKVKIISEAFAGIKDIKISKSENKFLSDFDKNSKKSNAAQLYSNMLTVIPRYVIEYCLIILVLTSVYFLAINSVNSGSEIDISKISVFFVACIRIYPSVNKLNSSIQRIIFSKPAFEEIQNELKRYFDYENIADANILFKKNIKLKDISFSYDNRNKILTNLNFKIYKNEKVAIYGPSGSGKSTFVNIISGLLNLNEGQMFVDDKLFTTKDLSKWMGNVGYVSQDISILDDNLINNITLKDKKIKDEKYLDSIIEDLGLHNIPKDKILGEKGSNISGGQKQRIGIARAIYLNPEILILDESTNSLDHESEKKIIDNLIKRDLTMILVSHDQKVLDYFKLKYKIENGQIKLV